MTRIYTLLDYIIHNNKMKVNVVEGMECALTGVKAVELDVLKDYIKVCKNNAFELTLPAEIKGKEDIRIHNRVYVDIDGKIPQNMTIQEYGSLTATISAELQTLFPNEFLMESCSYKASKLSYRIHYQKKCGTRKAIKLYVEKFVVPLFEGWKHTKFGKEFKSDTPESAYLELDLTIYNKNRKMRMLGCVKDKDGVLETDRPLLPLREPQETDLINSLITYTEGCEILPESYPKTDKKIVAKEELVEPRESVEKVVQKVLDGLDAKRYDNFFFWNRTGLALKQSLLPFEMWDEFSKKSGKYREGECRRMWDNMDISKIPIHLTTIWAYLKEDNPALYKTLLPKRLDLLGLMTQGCNDVELADAIYNIQPHDYMYSPELGWFIKTPSGIWDGKNGQKYPSAFSRKAYDVFTPIGNEYIEMYSSQKPLTEEGQLFIQEQISKIKALQHKCGQTATANNLKNVLTYNYTIEDLQKKMDEKRNLVPFSCGTAYDLETHELRKIEPDDFISLTTGYAYPTQSNEEIRKDIRKILYAMWDDDGMVDWILYSISLALFGKNKKQKFNIWTGSGGNGKGLLISLLKETFGDLFVSIPMTTLTNASPDKDEKNDYILETRGKRFLCSQETPSKEDTKFQSETIKLLSGGDCIKIRGIYSKPTEFLPAFTPFIGLNRIPKIDGYDNAISRRLNIVPFPFLFKDKDYYDPNVKNHRKVDETCEKKFQQTRAYREEMMLMLLKAYKKGHIPLPKTIEKANSSYKSANNALAEFLDGYINTQEVMDKDNWIHADTLRTAYQKFSNDCDMTKTAFNYCMVSTNDFYKDKLSNAFTHKGEKRPNGVYIKGIRKKTAEELDAELEKEEGYVPLQVDVHIPDVVELDEIDETRTRELKEKREAEKVKVVRKGRAIEDFFN